MRFFTRNNGLRDKIADLLKKRAEDEIGKPHKKRTKKPIKPLVKRGAGLGENPKIEK
jgi:hypothetical protein